MSANDVHAPDAGTAPDETPATADGRPRRSRVRRVLAIVGGSLAALIVAAVVGFLVWAGDAYPADAAAWQAVQEDPRIAVDSDGEIVVMTPRGEANGEGLVFLAGARVDPDAYAATFVETVAAGTTVVIVRPFLNLAILETRDFDAFTAEAPGVSSWAIGGHSMGGVRACGYAQDPDVTALVHLASYCESDDLSDRDDLRALSVSGTQDALATPEKIDSAAHLLPPATTFARIDGAAHAQFGAYGPQAGDGVPTLSDAEARALISDELTAFFAAPQR